jgi:hypothetical protein
MMRGILRKAAPILILGLLLSVSACMKAGLHATDVLRAGKDDAVTLVYETDKEGKIVAKGFSHPAQISADQISKFLSSLKYSELIFLRWKEQGNVFIDEEVQKLASPLSAALAQAREDQWIAFSVTSFKTDLIFKSKRLSTGWIWVKDGKLNLVLGNFRLILARDSEPYDGDPRARYAMTTYRMDPGKNFGPPPIDKNDEWLKREHNNWVVADLSVLTQEPEQPNEQPKEQPAPKPAQTVEERLEQIKILLDKGLITPEEYEAKRKEILGDL